MAAASADQQPQKTLAEVFLPISNPKVAPHRFILVEDATISRPAENVSINLPKGFLSDGCDKCIRAFGLEDWLIRDWMYATHQLSKTNTDGLIHGYDGQSRSRRPPEPANHALLLLCAAVIRVFAAVRIPVELPSRNACPA